MRLALLLLISGCDFFFPLNTPTPNSDGGTGVDAPPGTCLPGSVADNFDDLSANPCGDGNPDPAPPNTKVVRLGNRLELRPDRFGTGANHVACLWSGAPILEGVFAEIVMPLDAELTYTQIALNDGARAVGIKAVRVSSGGATNVYLFQADAADGGNEIPLSNEASYKADDMRWWRVRGVGTMVIGEISPNGADWSMLGSAPSPLNGATQEVSIAAGQFASSTMAPGIAVIDNFNSCP